MATAKTTETTETKKTETKATEKMVPVFVPRLPNSKNQPPLEGSVNGKAFLIPRGKPWQVPASVAEVVKRSLHNEQIAEDYYNSIGNELIEKSEKEAANLK